MLKHIRRWNIWKKNTVKTILFINYVFCLVLYSLQRLDLLYYQKKWMKLVKLGKGA